MELSAFGNLGQVRWIGFSLDSVTTALNVERNYPETR